MPDSHTPERKPRPGKARISRELGIIKKRRAAIAPAPAPEGVQLGNVRVVLANSAFAGNVGQSARAMLNMGLTRLYLANPTPRYRSPESRQMAVGAWEVIKNAKVTKALPEALEGTVMSVAFTAGKGRLRLRIDPFEEILPELAERSRTGDVALVFGSEVSGLTNHEIQKCSHAARLNVSEHFASLNLAQAVLVAASQVFGYRREPTRLLPPRPLATHDEVEQFLKQLRDMLERIRFLPEQNPDRFFDQMRSLFLRIPLEDREVRMLRGVLTNFEWNLDHPGKAKPKKE